MRRKRQTIFPLEEDLHMSRESIAKLQDMYDFSLENLTNGNITRPTNTMSNTFDGNYLLLHFYSKFIVIGNTFSQ